MNEIVVVGAGPVGAVCALALAQRDIGVRVLEAQAADARGDARTLALAHGARLILERLGVWDRLTDITPIKRIHVSQRGGLGVARLAAEDMGVPALGHVLPYAQLAAVLKDALREAGVSVEHDVAVDRIEAGEDAASLATRDGRTLGALLVVVADGGRGAGAPPPWLAADYAQAAVVCDVVSERPHAYQAYERFTPAGPVALLPKGDRYALVWTAPHAEAERIAALSDAEFCAALYAHFGGRQGRFLEAGVRRTFPLRLAYAGSAAAGRVVRIGNAAQTLHPVAGQGFNIGLRDAWELAMLCADAAPVACGDATMLAAYARGRRADVLGGVAFTDSLVRVFSSDSVALRHVRGLGLMAFDALPPIKAFVARRMMFGARG